MSKFDNRTLRMECLKLANALAIACKVDRQDSVTAVAESYFKFITAGDEGQITITLPEGMTPEEAESIAHACFVPHGSRRHAA